MGPSTDPDAVVNPELQVYGIKGLRVADASIIPILPASHTNAVVFMIGEKASDIIKNYWKNGGNSTFYSKPNNLNQQFNFNRFDSSSNNGEFSYSFDDNNNNIRRSFGSNPYQYYNRGGRTYYNRNNFYYYRRP